MTSISSYSSFASSGLASLFSKMDSDSSGTVSKEEFSLVTADTMSSDQSSSLFDAINDGEEFSVTDLASLFQQMATLLQAQEQGDSAATPPQNAEDLFSTLDTDGNGSVSREEFVTGRPDDMSEEDADALYSSVVGEDGDSMSLDQLSAMMPPPPPPGGMGGGMGGGSGSSTQETFSALDTNQDGTISLEEFLAARPESVSEEDATSLFQDIAGDSDSFTLEDLQEHQESVRLAPPPGEQQDFIQELLAALQDSDSTDSTQSTETSSNQASQQQYLLSAIQAYASASGGKTESGLGSLLAQAA